ncbi:nucleotidyltransferase domain-containing protein [Candidatus Bathyarchaeota archaeon]|nr:nucleotidyltransferase domain-containing protein [Candidatus Bathyarchaeota archaeon]
MAIYTLASDPLHSFYQRELAKEAGISVGSANGVLPELVKQELVLLEKKGKIHLYRYNLGDPVARQLKVFFNVLDFKELVTLIQPHAKRVVLFGSCSNGRNVKDSDIDLFILTDEKNLVSAKLKSYNTIRSISPLIVDVNEYISLRNRDKPLYDEILRGITLWEQE